MSLLGDIVVAYISDLLNNDYDKEAQYKTKFMSILKQMEAKVDIVGLQEPKSALLWWSMIESSRVS